MRLAEIDRKLRSIQADLDPDREPSPSPTVGAESDGPVETEAEGPVAPEPEEPAPGPPPEAPEAPEAPAPEPPRRGRSGPLANLLRTARERAREDARDGAREEAADRAQDAPPQQDAPQQPPEPPQPQDPTPTPTDLAALTTPQTKLVSAMRELLDAYGLTLKHLPATCTAEAGEVTVSAGPFTSTAAVRRFERELAAMPSVSEVVVRGYEVENRAIFDVQLSDASA